METPLNKKLIFTTEQIQHAKERFAFDQFTEQLTSLVLDCDPQFNEMSVEDAMVKIRNLVLNADPLDNEWIDETAKKHHWDYVSESIDTIHVGDCTAVPCMCDRCYAEKYFGVNTVTWSKAEGNSMLHEHEEQRKKESNNEEV